MTREKEAQIETSDYLDLTQQFNLDELDNWTTTTGLIKSVLSTIEKAIPSCTAHLFFHETESHEYREIDREGVATIPEDSLFIGCLSMLTGIVKLQSLFTDYKIDDPLLEQLLSSVYQGSYIIPVVHSFELLSFILICDKAAQDPITLKNDDIHLLKQLITRLQVNLYASSVADQRQRELLGMAEFPLLLKQHTTLEEIYTNMLDDLSKQIFFDKGVCYAYEPETQKLIPFCKKGIRKEIPSLNSNEGISGQVFIWNKPLFVPDRKSHPSYALIKEESFIDGSFISVPISSGSTKIGVIMLIRKPESKSAFGVEHRYMLEIATSFIATEIINRQLFTKLDDSNFNVVESLTKALEAKDASTEGHSARVTKYAEGIAEKLNYPVERIHQLKYGALLHDIGKIGISDAIINKHSKLTDSEFTEIKAHTEIGYNILDGNDFFNDIKDFVRYHHETIGGTGYYGKKIGEFPEEAMVISIADIFDALTSDRPYRKAMPVKDALDELKKQIGVHFTQQIYDAFKSYLEGTHYLLAVAS